MLSKREMSFAAFYNGKKVLITGGMGFIGSTLAIRLVELGAKVSVLDNELPDGGANRFNISPVEREIQLVIADLGNQEAISRLVSDQYCIFNLAGTLNHVGSMKLPHQDLHSNCGAHVTFLEECRKHNPAARVLYAGTRGQYGSPRSPTVNEDHPQEAVDVNGINKTAGEAYHLLYAKYYDLHYTSLRLSNTFGPRHQMRNPAQGVLNWFIRQILDEKPITIFGDGKQVRDIHYVDDVVEAMLLTLASSKTAGQAYNLGGFPVSLGDYARLLVDVNGAGEISFRDYPPDAKRIEIGNFVADCSKIKSDLGWTASTPLRDGCAKTLDYYRRHRANYW